MMQTTIQLSDDVLNAAEQLAATTQRSLGSVVEEALREMLIRYRATASLRPVHLMTYGEGGLQFGVDLDDSEALLAIMEEGEHVDNRR